MKTLTSLTGAALTATLVAALTLTPANAAETVDLSRPGSLERGDDLRIPHLEGTTVVDGDLRIEVPGAVSLLGRSGDDYVVQTTLSPRPRYRVERVTAEGDATVLLRGIDAESALLSDDGAHLVSNDYQPRTRLTAFDAADGTEVASLTIRRYAEVLDVDSGTVVVSSWQPRTRTVSWNLDTGARTRISDEVGYHADLSADRLAVLTGDPYRDGCSQVVSFAAPDTVLWESCRQRVFEFAPGGDLAATVFLLADGLGPNEVQLREIDGSLLVNYTAKWFGTLQWEDADTLLLESNGKRKGALVRCDGSDCERASALRPAMP